MEPIDTITKDDFNHEPQTVLGGITSYGSHDGKYGEFLVFHGSFALADEDGTLFAEADDMIAPGATAEQFQRAFDTLEDGEDTLLFNVDVLRMEGEMGRWKIVEDNLGTVIGTADVDLEDLAERGGKTE